MLRSWTLALLTLSLGGCVRAWWGGVDATVMEDTAANVVDGSVPEAAGPSKAVVDQRHDTCQTAKVIDLSTLPANGLTLTVDHSQAKRDYNLPLCCSNMPELVLKLVKIPDNKDVAVSCLGSEQIGYVTTSNTCPVSGGNCNLMTCGGGTAVFGSPASTLYVKICRAKGEGKVTLRLWLK
jgi:hypothetical protein